MLELGHRFTGVLRVASVTIQVQDFRGFKGIHAASIARLDDKTKTSVSSHNLHKSALVSSP
jgi:hypothetical protein